MKRKENWQRMDIWKTNQQSQWLKRILLKNLHQYEGMEKAVSGLSKPGSSLLGSFQSLNSSQSRGKDRMIPYVPPLKEMSILHFEDTLSEGGLQKFQLNLWIFNFRRKGRKSVGLNIGDDISQETSGMIASHAWKVDPLIISPEEFKEKKKAAYNALVKTKQISKGKGIGKHSKGISFGGLVEKEKVL